MVNGAILDMTNSERTDGSDPDISGLEMLETGSLEVPKSPTAPENANSGSETPSPVKETDETSEVSDLEMAKNGKNQKSSSDCKTPTPVNPREIKPQLSGKNGTPDRLKVPKAFKFPERYSSPTDSMMSPITRGLLARSRRGGVLLPPSKNHLKMQDLRISEMNLVYQS